MLIAWKNTFYIILWKGQGAIAVKMFLPEHLVARKASCHLCQSQTPSDRWPAQWNPLLCCGGLRAGIADLVIVALTTPVRV